MNATTLFSTIFRIFVTAINRATIKAAAVVVLMLSGPSHAAPGDLDVATFGPYSGLAYGRFPPTANHFFTMHDAIVLPDDRIVAGGTCTATGATPAGTRFCIAVWTVEGAGTVLYVHSSPVNRVSASARGAIAAQPDGKIVVTAPCRYSTVPGVQGFCTVRFNADFTPDTGFAVGYQNTAPSPTTNADSYPNAVAIQPDGKIVLAGQCGAASGTKFCAARLLANGQPDSTFGGSDSLRTFVGVDTTSAVDRAKRIAVAPDGKIYLGGDCRVSGSTLVPCVARLNADGSVDNAFLTTANTPRLVQRMSNPNPSTNSDTIYDMVVQANGEFIFAGDCRNTTNYQFPAPCALRLGAPGATDFASGTDYRGATASTYSSILREPASSGFTFSIVRVYLQPDGKMLALLQSRSSNTNYSVRRYNEDGSIDGNWFERDFDFNAATDNASGFARGLALAQQRSGKVIAMGYTQSVNIDNPQARVIRLENPASPGRNCSPDVDGDGKVLPTTDGLLLTRAAAGLTGNAVIGGAVGAGASRNTWPLIRDYLVTQCGMVLAP